MDENKLATDFCCMEDLFKLRLLVSAANHAYFDHVHTAVNNTQGTVLPAGFVHGV